MNSDSGLKHRSLYTVVSIIVLVILAILFAFPLYWIITGAFKTNASINATTPDWFPKEWVLDNFRKLFSKQSAPLWELAVPFSSKFTADGNPLIFTAGPVVPAAIRWLVNTVFMAVMAMILTCITSAMAICACQETFPGPGNAFYPDRLCDGAAQAGNSDSVTAGNVVLILV